MRELRNEQPTIQAVRLLLHDLQGIQPGESGEARAGVRKDTSLEQALGRLRKRFEAHASALEKRRCTSNVCLRWQTRGRQQILRAVAGHLGEICAKPRTAYALFVVLKDYLGCLEKYAVDAEEETSAPISGHAWPIQQWKAAGEACELPAIMTALRCLLSAYAPAHLEHILALNGSDLAPLREEEGIHVVERQAHLSVAGVSDEEHNSYRAS